MADRLDPLLHDAAIGEYFGRSIRFGRRFLQEWRGRFIVLHGKKYIYTSDFLGWLKDHEVEPAEQPVVDLKSTLKAISDRVLDERKKRA